MTAAERQRRCRENGKGRHRGKRYTRKEIRAIMAAKDAEETAEIAAAVGALPSGSLLMSPIAPPAVAPIVTAMPTPLREFEWSLTAMAA